MWPQKPGTAPGGTRAIPRAAPTIQGGAWPPISSPCKPSARSARKHAPQFPVNNQTWGGLGTAPLDSLVADGRPGTRGTPFSTSARGTRSKGWQPMVNTYESKGFSASLLASARDGLHDNSVELLPTVAHSGSIQLSQSSRGAFLTQEESSSLYQPNLTPFDSYQSPIQTRLQREIAHRSAKMITSTEMGFSDCDEKMDCPASLVRLRYQEHRFLVDELYQQQDLRKELEEKYSQMQEEFAACKKRMLRAEELAERDGSLEEIKRLKAYGESLEKDNHVTLQRLEEECEEHNDLKSICKVLLNSVDLEWQPDHSANLSHLERLANHVADLSEELEKERGDAKANADNLWDLQHRHQEVQHELEKVSNAKQHMEVIQVEFNSRCQAMVEACGLVWQDDHSTNMLMLDKAVAAHADLLKNYEYLLQEHAQLKSSHDEVADLRRKAEEEKELLDINNRSAADAQEKIHMKRVSILEERGRNLDIEIIQTKHQLSALEGQHKHLRSNCEELLRTVGMASEQEELRNLQSELATVGCRHVELQKNHADLLAVHRAMQEENTAILQREHAMIADQAAQSSAFQAALSSREVKYQDLAKAHAQLEMQWMELCEWRMPEQESPDDGKGHPKSWGISLQQLVQLHDEIIRDLEDYCSTHDFYLENHECVHVCRRQPCRFDGDHRNVKQKRRMEITDRTVLRPMMPNMYIVVDRYLKPQCLAHGPNLSYSKLKNPDGLQISTFVSHTWLEPFRDFVSSLKIALDPDEVIWVCSFALPQNEKQGIEAMLQKDLNHVPFSLALKHATKLVVVLDKGLSILQRAWCIYEIERARRWGIPTLLWAHQPSILMNLRSSIGSIDFRKATATYKDDQEAIVKAIEEDGGYDVLNDHLKRCIRDRAAICEMAVSEMKGELHANSEELAELRQKVAESVKDSNQCALDEMLELRRELERQLEEAERDGRTEGVEELKKLLRKSQLDEAALAQEKNLLVQMSKDMKEIRDKDNTEVFADGVSTKVLSVLEPMLQQMMTENRRGIQGVKMSVRNKGAQSTTGLRRGMTTPNLDFSEGNLQASFGNSSQSDSADLSTLLEDFQAQDENQANPPDEQSGVQEHVDERPAPPPLAMERAATDEC